MKIYQYYTKRADFPLGTKMDSMEKLRYHQYLEEMMVEVYMAEGKDAFDSIIDGAKFQVNYESERDKREWLFRNYTRNKD